MRARAGPAWLIPLARAVVGCERGWWLLKRYRPQRLARIMGVPKGRDPSADPDFLAIRESLFPVGPKRFGIAFDALVSEPSSNDFPLEGIDVPTLFIHAADDRLAPYEHVRPAVDRVPGACLVTVEAGGHLFLQHAGQVRAATSQFIDEVTRTSGVAR